jgi:adenine phosphoribosyltransferase
MPVVIADDLIATGARRHTGRIGFKLGGTVVECAFVIEASFLKGREKLKPYGVFSLVRFDSE